MRRRPLTLQLVALALGCTPKPAAGPTAPPEAAPEAAATDAPATAPPALDCGPQIRGAAALVEPGAVLLVGEVHGTAQVPEAVGRIVCNAARPHGPGVILGLEITADDQPAVDAFLASDGEPQAVQALLSASHFASETKDGRNSQAMLALLESVRRWRIAGAPIEVLCFDAPMGSWTKSAERDAAMARTLVAAKRARPEATLVTLSGNIHNRTVPGVPWDAAFVPMGVHVHEAFADLVSLDFRSAGGSFWACLGQPDGTSRCGAAQAGGEDRGSSPLVERFDAPNEHGFHGVLYVGTITASEPAVASGSE